MRKENKFLFFHFSPTLSKKVSEFAINLCTVVKNAISVSGGAVCG